MAIAQVFTYTPRPGGIEQFLAIAKRADKILRGLGAPLARSTPSQAQIPMLFST